MKSGLDRHQPTRLYLVRHGETEGNQRGAYLGWDDPPLSDRGRQQAEWLAAKLARVPVTVIYSSDLRRAADTAVAIAARHGIAIKTTSALRELNFGAWSEMTYDAIASQNPDQLRAWIDDPAAHAPPGGETLDSLASRVAAAVPPDDGAVVVTHGGPIRALLARWTGRSMWEFTIPTGCLVTVERGYGRLLSYVIDVPGAR